MAFSDQWTPVRRSGTMWESNDESSEEVRCGGTCGERPVLLFYFQMVEFRGFEGLERKLRTGLRPEVHVGQWCIRVSRVSPPASSPRPSLPYSSLWPTSLTVKFNGSSGYCENDADREGTGVGCCCG